MINNFITKLSKFNKYKNPYYYWWKVRKYWKMPKLHLAYIGKVTWWFGLPAKLDFYNKYISIDLVGLGWKDYFKSARYELNPYLCITFFRKWQIIFIWNFIPHFYSKKDPTQEISASESTWETILEMTEFNHNIADACHLNGISKLYSANSPKNTPPKLITVFRNMTKYGLEQYYREPMTEILQNENEF